MSTGNERLLFLHFLLKINLTVYVFYMCVQSILLLVLFQGILVFMFIVNNSLIVIEGGGLETRSL